MFYDVKKDRDKLDEMLKITNGNRRIPVIVDQGEVVVGCGGA